jgi:hypothetical protein
MFVIKHTFSFNPMTKEREKGKKGEEKEHTRPVIIMVY